MSQNLTRSIKMAGTIIGSCAGCCAGVFAISFSVVILIFGIFFLVPAGPIDERNTTAGIIMVVFSCVGISGIVGGAVGAVFGTCIGAPAECIAGDV